VTNAHEETAGLTANFWTPVLFYFYFPTTGNNNMANAQTFEAGTPHTYFRSQWRVAIDLGGICIFFLDNIFVEIKLPRWWRAAIGFISVCSKPLEVDNYGCVETQNVKMPRIVCKVKVQCTLVQALRLCTGRTANRGSSGIALPFHDHGTRRGWGVSVTPRPLFTPGKNPIHIVQEAGWAPGAFWTGAENIAPTGIRSPDRQARS
jgi:hypothetical protein